MRSDRGDCLQGCLGDDDAACSVESKQRLTLADTVCSVPGMKFNSVRVVRGTRYVILFTQKSCLSFSLESTKTTLLRPYVCQASCSRKFSYSCCKILLHNSS